MLAVYVLYFKLENFSSIFYNIQFYGEKFLVYNKFIFKTRFILLSTVRHIFIFCPTSYTNAERKISWQRWRMAYLQGSFSSKESWDRCFTRSRVPVGPPSEKCTPNDRFLCGNVPPRFPPIVSVITLLFSFGSSSNASLSSRWFGNEPQNLYLKRVELSQLFFFPPKKIQLIFQRQFSRTWRIY